MELESSRIEQRGIEYFQEKKKNADELIGKTLTFSDSPEPENVTKTTTVTIVGIEDVLGSGKFSNWVREVKVQVPFQKKLKEANFVLKKFKSPQYARGAFEKFQMLKDAELKTWATYRIDNENDIILMTNGNSQEKSLMTCNENLCELANELSEHKLKAIKNLDTFLKAIFAEAKKAKDRGLYIHKDTYGFLVDKKASQTKETDMDFILADTDNVRKVEDLPKIEFNTFNNFDQLAAALTVFLDKYVDSEEFENYRQKVEEICERYKQNFPLEEAKTDTSEELVRKRDELLEDTVRIEKEIDDLRQSSRIVDEAEAKIKRIDAEADRIGLNNDIPTSLSDLRSGLAQKKEILQKLGADREKVGRWEFSQKGRLKISIALCNREIARLEVLVKTVEEMDKGMEKAKEVIQEKPSSAQLFHARLELIEELVLLKEQIESIETSLKLKNV